MLFSLQRSCRFEGRTHFRHKNKQRPASVSFHPTWTTHSASSNLHFAHGLIGLQNWQLCEPAARSTPGSRPVLKDYMGMNFIKGQPVKSVRGRVWSLLRLSPSISLASTRRHDVKQPNSQILTRRVFPLGYTSGARRSATAPPEVSRKEFPEIRRLHGEGVLGVLQ